MARVDLTGARATLLATLYARALDAGSSAPVLADGMALDALIATFVEAVTIHQGRKGPKFDPDRVGIVWRW